MSQFLQAVSMALESPAQAILDQPAVISGLTPELIQDMARRILNDGRYVRLTLLPEN